MGNNISTLVNEPRFIRKLIEGNNIIWYLMYYDQLTITSGYHLTLLKGADLLFYNAAQAVSLMDAKILEEIEAYYQQYHISPAFYIDPASINWLKPFLNKHHYLELPTELENWWGILLEKEVMHIKFQDCLKIPGCQVSVKIIDPQNPKDLNLFLTINQATNQLPDLIVSNLRANMKNRLYPGAKNTLLIIYVNDIPASIRTIGLYNDMAFLAEAGTLALFQKQGLHTFSMSFALKYAYEQGARVAALTCTKNSITNFTSQRVGLKLLFQRVFMRKLRT